MRLAPLPASRFCLTCRTVLGEGEPCDAGAAHVTVDLREPAGWSHAVEVAWLRCTSPLRPAPAARSRLLLPAMLAWLWLVWVLCSPWREIALLVTPASVLLGVWSVRRRPRPPRRRRGGGAGGPAAPRAGSVGTVVAPESSDPCAAALVLALGPQHGGGLTLQHAWGSGFVVMLDDGSQVRVPAGRLRIVSVPSMRRGLSRAAVEHALAHLGLTRGRREGPGTHPFPCGVAHVVEVRPGDRIPVLGPLSLDAAGGGGVYRTAASRELVTVGIPALRVLTRTHRRGRHSHAA